jgi:hypothetical protein
MGKGSRQQKEKQSRKHPTLETATRDWKDEENKKVNATERERSYYTECQEVATAAITIILTLFSKNCNHLILLDHTHSI